MLTEGKSGQSVLGLRDRRRREMCTEVSSIALALFERKGFAATTVEDIAREAGISQSTFFRHFPTKEESVVGIDAELERAIIDQVVEESKKSAESLGLDDIEAVCEVFMMRTCDDADTLERVLRVRRLMLSDSHLRTAAIALDGVVVERLVDAIVMTMEGRESKSYARLIAQTAMTTLHVAFDEWAARLDGGDSLMTVPDAYRIVCRNLRRAVQT